MSAHAERRALWLAGTLASVTLAIALWLANAQPLALPIGLAVELSILLVARRAMQRRRAWDASLHARARWVGLDALRIAAMVAYAAAIVISFFGLVLGSGILDEGPILAALAAALSALGWAFDRPRRAPSLSPRLSRVQRAIDARGWKDAEEPDPHALRDALTRWGAIDEGDL